MLGLGVRLATISEVRRHRLLSALLIALPLGGCFLGSEAKAPEVWIPTDWTRPHAAAFADERALAHWWTTFDDPTLSSLIARAITGNRDLRRAVARVREARARRLLARAELFPLVSATGAQVHRQTDDTNTTLYTVGFDASWELDLFGGQRSEVAAATATLQARQEDVRDALVTLTSEVALNYIDACVATARLATAEANLRTQREALEIARYRYEAGLTALIDVEQARTILEQTRSTIPTLEIQREQALNRLAVLLGEPAGALDPELATARPIPVAPITIAIGLPADVLRRRPDVRRAERELVAQTARIGVARAELYPSLRLGGTIGLETLSLRELLSAGAQVLTTAIDLAQPVFTAGRIRQNIEIETALQEQAALAYEQAILVALEEVENALVAYAEEQARREALVAARDAARSAAELAGSRYETGITDFLVVLDAQRTLLTIEDQLAVSSGNVVANLVRLYKAAGGGWTPITRGDG